jgi:single-stranded DNA-specific DHH superfamily exonuclease
MAENVCRPGELERLREFLGAARDRKGFLLYHGDADGICSAALFLRFFRGFEYSPRKGPIMGEDFVRLIMNKKPGLLVFLDLPVDQEWRRLRGFLRGIPGLRIAIIDHHIAERDMSSGRVLHINPRFLKKDVYVPAACILYRILEGFGRHYPALLNADKPGGNGVRPLIWMAAMGVIGDYGWRGCPGLMEECREEYPYLLRGGPLRSRLGEGADIIAAAATLKGLSGVSECLKALVASQGFEDFESAGKLQEWKSEIDDELQFILDDFKKKRHLFGKENLVVYEVKSGLNLTSMVATKIGEMFPGRIVAIRKSSGGNWKVSLRGQNTGLNLGDIAKSCVKGIGSGGGHEKAAAALVSDWGAFLKRLRRELVRASS